jgi:hypothetical protein
MGCRRRYHGSSPWRRTLEDDEAKPNSQWGDGRHSRPVISAVVEPVVPNYRAPCAPALANASKFHNFLIRYAAGRAYALKLTRAVHANGFKVPISVEMLASITAAGFIGDWAVHRSNERLCTRLRPFGMPINSRISKMAPLGAIAGKEFPTWYENPVAFINLGRTDEGGRGGHTRLHRGPPVKGRTKTRIEFRCNRGKQRASPELCKFTNSRILFSWRRIRGEWWFSTGRPQAFVNFFSLKPGCRAKMPRTPSS